ncbi:hypothetical protein BDR03DRAFT_987176 [Suillus americanus]|nr:hypothetical protein BDR03DRAFT_987176 [Suillus americanus]
MPLATSSLALHFNGNPHQLPAFLDEVDQLCNKAGLPEKARIKAAIQYVDPMDADIWRHTPESNGNDFEKFANTILHYYPGCTLSHFKCAIPEDLATSDASDPTPYPSKIQFQQLQHRSSKRSHLQYLNSSVARPTPPAKDIPSNMDMYQTEASFQDSEQQTAGHTPMLPKMCISSSRREAWLRRHTLDKPLVFLHHFLAEEEHIEKADFVQEIMDFFPKEQERDRWSERVDHLYEGLTTWCQFSQLLAGSLDLQDGRRDDGTGFTKGEKSESPFPTLDAKIAIRSYLRHLKEKPQDADQLFCACVDQFSTIPSSDSVWRSVQSLSQTLGSINKVLKSADTFWYNRVHLSAGKKQEDQLSTPSNTLPDYTPDTIVEFQDEMDICLNSPSDQISQFTTAPDEDDQTTSEDHFRSESIFSLVDVERAIRSYSHDGISFNELRNILLTDIPPIHVQTVHEALRTLDPCRVDKKILNSLFKKLEEEELLAKRDYWYEKWGKGQWYKGKTAKKKLTGMSGNNLQTQGHTSESQGNMFGSQLKRQKNQVRNFSFGNHVTVPSLKFPSTLRIGVVSEVGDGRLYCIIALCGLMYL